MHKIVKNALLNAKKGRWFTLACVVVMSFSFFLLSIFITVGAVSYNLLRYLETRAQITVFFKDSTSEQEILLEKDQLEKDPNILEARYTSKDTALQNYISEHKDEPLLLESLTKDIFPASLDIRARDLAYLPQVEKKYKENTLVEEVVFYKDVVNSFKQFSNIIVYGGLALVVLLLLTSTITVLLTIGSSIYVKNEEISVMRLVGASNWYIRGPFLLQGVLYGTVAAVISEVVLTVLVSFLGNDIAVLFKGIDVIKINWLYLVVVFFIQILFGAFLGLLASWGALRRYLKI